MCGSRCSMGADKRPVLSVLPAPKPDAALDPRAEMERLALRLVSAHEGDPQNTLLARELRMTLHELMPKDGQLADADLTGLFAALQA